MYNRQFNQIKCQSLGKSIICWFGEVEDLHVGINKYVYVSSIQWLLVSVDYSATAKAAQHADLRGKLLAKLPIGIAKR